MAVRVQVVMIWFSWLLETGREHAGTPLPRRLADSSLPGPAWR
jgi:hypothetical protein